MLNVDPSECAKTVRVENETYLDDKKSISCCGCESCSQICPQQCITMEFGDDGFAYPVIDKSKCTECNLCRQVCPIVDAKKAPRSEQSQICYYGWHQSAAIRYESTSGGAFSAIAEQVLEENGFIYGAMYGDALNVCHGEVQKRDDLGKLRQSKYVQSEIGTCYTEIRKQLRDNKKVLFCGTPCQVHGLRTFLRKTYENLLLVDFVCHGVTSPKLFKRYIDSLERKYNSKVKRIRFRDKVTIGNFSSLAFTTIEFENRRKISSEINSYLIAYMHGLMQRESCEGCPYATVYRWSDITIADFWGIEKFVANISEESDKGISLLLINSGKGKDILSRMKERMSLHPIDIAAALNGKNQQLVRPVMKHPLKLQFYRDASSMSMESALVKCIGVKNYFKLVVGMIKNRIKIILPKSGRRKLAQYLRGQ